MDIYDSFMVGLNAVVPFLIYMTFGYVVVRVHLVKEEALYKTNQIVFRCFYAVNMFYNFYTMDFSQGFEFQPVIFTVVLSIVFMVIVYFLVPLFVHQDNRKGVIIQALIRSNSLIFALPFTAILCGENSPAKMLASVLVALIVPLNNVMSVLILERFGEKQASKTQLVVDILTNPLIVGSLIGLIALLLKLKLPTFIEKPVKAFSDMTTPLALFVLGGTLHFSSVFKHKKILSWVTILRLLVIPALALLVMYLFDPIFHFTPGARVAIFMIFATPTAVASYTTAANMGGDGALAGEIVAMTTLISVLSLFLWIVGLRAFGIF